MKNRNHAAPHADALTLAPHEFDDTLAVKGFFATYDRKFNLGDFESLNPAITIWVRCTTPEGELLNLHHAKERVRRMARENVRAQLLRQQGQTETVFLGLEPATNDPILVRTVSVSLIYKVNLGNYQSITPGYTDWVDVRHITHNPTELHIALDRMWQSLWANLTDEISRAQGHGSSNGFFGLPAIPVDDLINAATNGRHPS